MQTRQMGWHLDTLALLGPSTATSPECAPSRLWPPQASQVSHSELCPTVTGRAQSCVLVKPVPQSPGHTSPLCVDLLACDSHCSSHFSLHQSVIQGVRQEGDTRPHLQGREAGRAVRGRTGGQSWLHMRTAAGRGGRESRWREAGRAVKREAGQ